MNQWLTEPTRLLILVGACVFLWRFELSRPFHPRPERREKAYRANLTLTALVLALNLGLTQIIIGGLIPDFWLQAGLLNRIPLPWWLAGLAGIAGLDFLGYLAHVTMHKIGWGWRVHKVHHSETHVDVTTAYRQHPGETLIRFSFQLAGVLILGVSPLTLALYVLWSALNAQFEHANFSLPEPVDRVVRILFVTPNVHKLHHSTAETDQDTNFGNIFSIWDRICGTYRSPAKVDPLTYGLSESPEDDIQSSLGLLELPFR